MNFCTILDLLINNNCGVKARRKSWTGKYIAKMINENSGNLIIARFSNNINWIEYTPDSNDMLATDWEIVNDK